MSWGSVNCAICQHPMDNHNLYAIDRNSPPGSPCTDCPDQWCLPAQK